MPEKKYGEMYLRYEKNIEKVLNRKKIYDEDLLHDAYIELYEKSQQEKIEDFVSAFVGVYENLLTRSDEHESHYDCHDNTHMLKYDRAVEDDPEYREDVSKRLDRLIRNYSQHPQKGERNHERTLKILRLYRKGLNETEISRNLKISQPTVHLYLKRAIERLKAIAK